MSRLSRLALPATIVAVAFLATFGLVYALLPQLAPESASEVPTPTIVADPRVVSDFALTDQDGKTLRLSDLRGKAVVMFFGYTHCPDICPLTLTEMVQARRRLDPQEANDTAFVFVSVDGERDTPEVLKGYVAAFSPDFRGLTGTADEVRAVAQRFGASFQKQKPKDTQAAYLMLHTASTYLMDREGRLRMVFPYGSSPESLTQGIRSVGLNP